MVRGASQATANGVAQSGTRLKRLGVHTHMWGCNDNCLQKRSYSGFCRHKFQTQPTFKKPTAKGKLSSHHLREKKEGIITPNLPHQTRCSASLIAAGMPMKRKVGNQIPTLTMASITSLQTINAGEGPEEKESP